MPGMFEAVPTAEVAASIQAKLTCFLLLSAQLPGRLPAATQLLIAGERQHPWSGRRSAALSAAAAQPHFPCKLTSL